MGLTDTLKVSCRKASELIERREFRALGPGERFGQWMHLRICASCRAYVQHSALIDRWLEKNRDVDEVKGSDALRARILRDIGSAE